MGNTRPDWFKHQRLPDCDSCYESPCDGILTWENVVAILNDPPTLPINYSVYLVGTTPTGVWSGQANQFAVYTALNNKWTFCSPYPSQVISVQSEPGIWYYWTGSLWEQFSLFNPPLEFIALTDTPNSYPPGTEGYAVVVNGTLDGLEYAPGTGITDHTLLSNIGTNTHAQIDSHIADTSIHTLVNTVVDSGAGDVGLIDTVASTPASIVLRGLTAGLGVSISNTPDAITISGDVTTDPIWNAAGDIARGTGVDTADRLPIGSGGAHLRSNGTTFAWSTASYPDTAAQGDLQIATLTNNWDSLGIGTAGQQLTVVGGLPAWADAISNFDSIQFTTGLGNPAHSEGLVFYDDTSKALAYYNEEADVTMQLGQEEWIRVYNETGVTINNGSAVYITGSDTTFPTVALAQANDAGTADAVGFATHDIEDLTYGYVTRGGIVNGVDTSTYTEGDDLYLSPTVAGAFQAEPPHLPDYTIHLGHVVVVNATTGSFFVDVRLLPSDYPEIIRFADGMAFQKATIQVVKVLAILTVELEQEGGGDINYLIDGVYCTLDCTTGSGTGGKASVNITAGIDANTPTENYIYVDNVGDVATLRSSTTLPTGAFTWVGNTIVPDASTFDVTGPFLLQRFTESFSNNNRGALSHQREKLRQRAEYISGGTFTVVGSPSATIHLDVASALVYQLHRQTFPAIPSGPYYYGNGLDIYEQIATVSAITAYQDGTPIGNNDRFNLIFFGATNADGQSKLFVNVPTGPYNSDAQALADVDNTADYSVPNGFAPNSFLIARCVFSYSSGGGVWTELDSFSLLGSPIGQRSGGSAAVASNEFVDSSFRIFDNLDSSKQISFQADQITTGQVREITMSDHDYTIDPEIWVNAGAMIPDTEYVATPGTTCTAGQLVYGSFIVDVMDFDPVSDGSCAFTVDVEQWMVDINGVRELAIDIYFDAGATVVTMSCAAMDSAVGTANGSGTLFQTASISSGATTDTHLNVLSGDFTALGSWAAPPVGTVLFCRLALKSGTTTAATNVRVLKVNIRPGSII